MNPIVNILVTNGLLTGMAVKSALRSAQRDAEREARDKEQHEEQHVLLHQHHLDLARKVGEKLREKLRTATSEEQRQALREALAWNRAQCEALDPRPVEPRPVGVTFDPFPMAKAPVPPLNLEKLRKVLPPSETPVESQANLGKFDWFIVPFFALFMIVLFVLHALYGAS